MRNNEVLDCDGYPYEGKEPEKVVKCACGLPMRQKNWLSHWRTCRVGSSMPVEEQDVRDLEAHEKRKQA